jgi:uncharacterized FlaG/YvyC family protein
MYFASVQEDGAMDITGINGPGPLAENTAVPATPVQAAENHDLVQAVRALNAAESFGNENELTFLLDRTTRLPVIRVVNRKTKEVIDQIPQQYVLQLAADLRERSE